MFFFWEILYKNNYLHHKIIIQKINKIYIYIYFKKPDTYKNWRELVERMERGCEMVIIDFFVLVGYYTKGIFFI